MNMRKIKTLKKNYEFKNVLNKGKFYLGKQIIIYIKRNRLKRLIRENYRLIKDNLEQGYNIVFLWNKKVDFHDANFFIIEKDMKSIFKKIGIL